MASANAQLLEYSDLIENVLRPQLQATLARRDALDEEMKEYAALQELLQAWPPRKLLLDLGQRFHVRAKATDTSLLMVAIGLDVHAQMTPEEAQTFVVGHLEFLHMYVLLRVDHDMNRWYLTDSEAWDVDNAIRGSLRRERSRSA